MLPLLTTRDALGDSFENTCTCCAGTDKGLTVLESKMKLLQKAPNPTSQESFQIYFISSFSAGSCSFKCSSVPENGFLFEFPLGLIFHLASEHYLSSLTNQNRGISTRAFPLQMHSPAFAVDTVSDRLRQGHKPSTSLLPSMTHSRRAFLGRTCTCAFHNTPSSPLSLQKA